ncbi:2-hydroxyacyl-CoA lyase 2-like [Palaemon carinicauda]|uniref:2-hydroxyacyl-CoA lyase 2-like n=1 Tax=Palaemon carinicauda TaxID=392227 RepID=UPI0035B636AB
MAVNSENRPIGSPNPPTSQGWKSILAVVCFGDGQVVRNSYLLGKGGHCNQLMRKPAVDPHPVLLVGGMIVSNHACVTSVDPGFLCCGMCMLYLEFGKKELSLLWGLLVCLVKVDQCAQLISKAKKPVFVLGSQSTLPPTPVDDLRRSLERLGIPCFLGGMSRGLLGQKSAIQMRQCRKDALKEADVIILAGAVCDFRLGYGRSLGRKAKIIAVNRNKEQLYKNADMFWKPTVAVLGDVGTFVRDLAAHIMDYKCDPEWVATLRDRDEAKEASNLKMAEVVPEKHLNPMKVFMELEKHLPDDAILVADGGDFVATAAYILRPRGPLTWLDPGAFGTLGVGGGFALGAKLCRPDSEVWIIYGDGSLGYSLSEFDTYTRHKTPVIAFVGNDAGWTQIAREQVPMFGTSVACDLAYCDYHKAVEGLGARGILIGRGDDLPERIKEVQRIYKEEQLSVLANVLIGKSKFREGSISV